jgi:hypothetical protein
MAEVILLDNDIILKACSFSLTKELLDVSGSRNCSLWMLGVAEFVIRKRLKKSIGLRHPSRIAEECDLAMQRFGRLEPDDEEIKFAAGLEAAAQEMAVQLDTGESLLIAILVRRFARLLITGDKRAVVATHCLCGTAISRDAIKGRVVCLEQLMLTLLDHLGLEALAARVCAEPAADKTLAICFSCSSGITDEPTVREGLRSYLADLRARSGDVLLPGDVVSRVVA